MSDCNNFGSASFVDKSELNEIPRNNSEPDNSESLNSNSESPRASNINGTDQKDPSSKAQEINHSGVNYDKDTNEHLDYEVEDGECIDSEKENSEGDDKKVEKALEELEDGEILDDDDTFIPERFETRNVCKFFLRGRCSWGLECKFLHCDLPENGNYKLEPVESAVSHLTYDMVNKNQVSNPWEHSLLMAKRALHNTSKYKKKLQEEKFDYENKRISSPEVRFSGYPQTRNYTPVKYSRRQESTYEPKYSRNRSRETCRSSYKHENKDFYKSKRPKREVSIPRDKEAWIDPWKRSNAAGSSKQRRNYSSSSSSTSDSLSGSSSKSRSSSELHKKDNRRNRKNRRSLNHKETEEQNYSGKFRRSRKQIVTSHKKARGNEETKRLIESPSRSSTSDSDRSVSKTRNRNNRRR